jgi:putative transposase
MSQSTAKEAAVTGRNPTGHHHRVVASPTWEWVGAKREPACLSREAQIRQTWLTWHKTKSGGNVSLTCRHFGISRPTFHRWQRQLNRQGLSGLENRSHKPHCVRRRTWTAEQIEAVLRVRLQYPAWGKVKIRVILAREGIHLSTSMIGRILTHLRARNLLREPVRCAPRSRREAYPRPWARRKPSGFVALFPGDLVQVDTKDVRPISGKVFKQLTLVDVVSRYAAAEIGIGAKALTMADYLDRMLERLPFHVAGIQIDGGSEFKADFEAYCEKKGLALFVLPPYSPKLNGAVERLQRTYEEEHHRCSDVELRVDALRQALLQYETVYNTIRPHQALGYRTPQEYLDLGKVAA